MPGDSAPPVQRQQINQRLTAELNQRLGLQLTDAFCGFKAYRVAALEQLRLQETGYAMPLELWVQAVALGLRIVELPVPLIYLEEERSFGGMLDDADTRLRYYYEVLERSIRRGGLGGACGSRSASVVGVSDERRSPTRLPTNACAPRARMGSRCLILRWRTKRHCSNRIWRCGNRPMIGPGRVSAERVAGRSTAEAAGRVRDITRRSIAMWQTDELGAGAAVDSRRASAGTRSPGRVVQEFRAVVARPAHGVACGQPADRQRCGQERGDPRAHRIAARTRSRFSCAMDDVSAPIPYEERRILRSGDVPVVWCACGRGSCGR